MTTMRDGVVQTPPVSTHRLALPTLDHSGAGRLQRWERPYQLLLTGLDALAVLLAALIGHALDLGSHGPWVAGQTFGVVLASAAPLWVGALASVGGYEIRYLGSGPDEYKRVGSALVRFTAVGAFLLYVFDTEAARAFVLVALPLAWLLTATGRWGARRWLHHQRRSGLCSYRMFVIGSATAREQMDLHVRREWPAGYRVVSGTDWRGTGSVQQVVAAALAVDADVLAVAANPGLPPEKLRELSWALEGSGLQLVVAPALTDVAGPRIHIRPVAGLPLLHVEEPEHSGRRLLVKHVIDRVLALALLAVLSPLLLAAMIALRIDSSGPAVFRQYRTGRHGHPFRIVKLRTMHVDANERFAEVFADQAETPFVKAIDDARITPVGRLLRRLSIDELPQLVNVVKGEMSLVGPRPLPLASDQDATDRRRRLLVRPGMTGLWQVSGRSNLPLEEALRLDLFYVENWSLAFDAMILWRTLRAIVHGQGAY